MKIKQRIWINKTCGGCIYRAYDSCRLNPPSILGEKLSNDETIIRVDYYPVVMDVRTKVEKRCFYQRACSKWEIENDTT